MPDRLSVIKRDDDCGVSSRNYHGYGAFTQIGSVLNIIAKQIPPLKLEGFKSYSQFLDDASTDRNVGIFSLVYYWE